MAIIERICENIISSLYQYALTAIIMSVFFMCVYEKIDSIGIKKTVIEFVKKFKEQKEWRETLVLAFYISMILLRTVLCRKIWGNPISNVLGNWSFRYSDGSLNTELLENIILFIPFSFFLLLRLKADKTKMMNCLICALKYSAFFSFSIEASQILFRVGTFQISDLLTNILGGILGGMLYYMFYRIKSHWINKN